MNDNHLDVEMPKRPPTRPTIPLPILSFISALLLLSTGVLAYQNMQLQTQIAALQVIPAPTYAPEPTAAVDSMAKWNTYTDAKYEYSFQYPSDWIINQNASSDAQKRLEPVAKDDSRVIWVRAGSTYFKDINTFSDQLGTCRQNSECITIYAKNKTTLGGIEAIKYIRSQLGPNNVMTITALKNGYEYSLDFEPYITEVGDDKIFDQILSTFTFTESLTSVPANWKSYVNQPFGYSIKYPPVFSQLICEDEANQAYFMKTQQQDPVTLASCPRDSRYPIEIVVQDSFQAPVTTADYSVVKENYTLDGINGYKYVMTRKPQSEGPGPTWSIDVVVVKNNKTYDLHTNAKENEALFLQMLTAFKFSN